MSDTRRHCDPEDLWGPGVLAFEEWQANHPVKIVSRKHQEKDRPSRQAGKRHRFVNGKGIVKNSRHNLLRKIDQLRLREALEE